MNSSSAEIPRSRERENAFLVYYAQHFKNAGPEENIVASDITKVLNSLRPDEKAGAFLLELVHLAHTNKIKIQKLIQTHLKNWRLERLAKVDVTLLILGTAELHYLSPATPKAVVCNEYVELAKRYGHADSANFINATLESIAQSSN